MKHLSILGSTGSIGRNTLDVVEMFPDHFAVKVLAAKSNITLLAEQIERFRPEIAVVFDEKQALELKKVLKKMIFPATRLEILYGEDGYNTAATHGTVDMVIVAVVGAAGLKPTLAAIRAGKDIALANKETLVMAGDIVMQAVAEEGVYLLPIDSEHSAIFQCLQGHRKEDVDKIILTASGGPFLNTPANEFSKIKPEAALNHPTWQMGRKISIDSATLMNKGFEVLEAKYLFNVTQDMIKVVIHPQSVIHSMVSYCDGSIIAQLGIPDMKGAIAYAMSYPQRLPLRQPLPDFSNIGGLTFQEPDLEKFPCLDLAYRACDVGQTLPAVLNAADEVAVNAFLTKRISFENIPKVIRKTMEKHSVIPNSTLSDILQADEWARKQTEKIIRDFQ